MMVNKLAIFSIKSSEITFL